MNPKEIRQAIHDGLAATTPFDAADMQRFRYPPGSQADSGDGFALGDLDNIEAEPLDLASDAQQITYDMGILFWHSGDVDTDDAFAALEATALAYVAAFEGWLATVGHGKHLGIDDVVVDSMELAEWELGFTIDPPSAVVEGTIEIVEIIP